MQQHPYTAEEALTHYSAIGQHQPTADTPWPPSGTTQTAQFPGTVEPLLTPLAAVRQWALEYVLGYDKSSGDHNDDYVDVIRCAAGIADFVLMGKVPPEDDE